MRSSSSINVWEIFIRTHIEYKSLPLNPPFLSFLSIIYIYAMNKKYCAPGTYDSKNDTCFTDQQVRQIAEGYNAYIFKNKLSPGNLSNKRGGKGPIVTLIEIKSDKKYLLNELRERFHNVCNGSDLCLSKQEFMNNIVSSEYEKIVSTSFRPEGPEKAREWLSTSDIDQVMKQYENVYKDFKFMGAVPSDCSDVSYCALSTTNYDALIKKGIKRVGIIFNHDKHNQNGSHWVGTFIDLSKAKFYYCDSTGSKPVAGIKRFVESVRQFFDSKGLKMSYKENSNKYQKDNSECGIYSCNFIIRMLAEESFEDITSNPLDFSEINLCRNVYFSNEPVKKKDKASKKCDP